MKIFFGGDVESVSIVDVAWDWTLIPQVRNGCLQMRTRAAIPFNVDPTSSIVGKLP